MFNLVNRFAQRTTSKSMAVNPVRLTRHAMMAPTQFAFSTEEGKDAAAAAEPTQAELDAHKHEWGIKYNDECFKFEKEW